MTLRNQRDTHPRPQLVRKQWHDLSGPWGFAFDDGGVGKDERWFDRSDVFSKTIIVPFPPESPLSGIHDTGPHSVVWYRRTFRHDSPELGDNDRLMLHFGAVDYAADVWVNGQHVVRHEGGHTPFSADVTNTLRHDHDEQVVVVRAEDFPFDLTLPRGKQDWQTPPHRIWYHRTTGIWQPVWLEPVAASHIQRVRWTPDVDRGIVGLQASLSAPTARSLRLRVRLMAKNRTLADDVYTVAISGDSVTRDLVLVPGGVPHQMDDLLWSPERPNLIDAELTLMDGEDVIDHVLSYLGFRSVEVANGQFRLNNRACFLRLVLEQGYWPESHLAAPAADAIRREVELTKDLGFNGVRIHQKVEDPRFLYWCDRLGLLVWAEMANAYGYSPEAVERLVREWLEVVRRDYSHPSIVTWVPLNESWGVPALQGSADQRHYLQALYHLTKAIDRTRPVITNDGWEHVKSDIWGVHDYAFDGNALRTRYGSTAAMDHTLRNVNPGQHPILLGDPERAGEPIMVTEYGGISFAPSEGERWHGYGTVESVAEYEEKYEELTTALLECATIAGFCYTQLTDTEQETNGLLTAARVPKLDPERIRDITTRPAASLPTEVTAAHRKRAQS